MLASSPLPVPGILGPGPENQARFGVLGLLDHIAVANHLAVYDWQVRLVFFQLLDGLGSHVGSHHILEQEGLLSRGVAPPVCTKAVDYSNELVAFTDRIRLRVDFISPDILKGPCNYDLFGLPD